MTLGRFRTGLALAVLLTTGAALRAADDKVDGDLKKLQGQWAAKDEGGATVTYTFEGRKLKVVAPKRTYEITVTLDPEHKPDKTIDLKIDEAPPDAKGQTSLGIYKFDGDKLILCFAPQGERPKKFEQVGYEIVLVELTRNKDKD